MSIVAKNWTYEKAGVPHLKGDAGYNREISDMIGSTKIAGMMGGATGFAACFDLPRLKIKDPILVSSTDGVGTKLEVARLQGKHDSVGIDLVAMCVNDIITTGAQPLFFLDYFATGKFQPDITRAVLKGIVRGCRESGCALVGGETAIMPGFYQHHDSSNFSQYDLAGFSVGVVERKKMITGQLIHEGDAVLGIESSGFHSNGFSLLRKIFSEQQLKGEWGKKLLTPTRIYVRAITTMLRTVPILGIANITGGGFIDNLPRILPARLGVRIKNGSWPVPDIFEAVRALGGINEREMMRTFNQGIGMAIIVKKRHVANAQNILKKFNYPSWEIGTVVKGEGVEIA